MSGIKPQIKSPPSKILGYTVYYTTFLQCVTGLSYIYWIIISYSHTKLETYMWPDLQKPTMYAQVKYI